MIDNRLKLIALHYRKERQIDKTVEEIGELARALMKYKHKEVNIEEVIDEIADNYVLLTQLLYLLDIEDEVQDRIEFKINRQLDRIERRE